MKRNGSSAGHEHCPQALGVEGQLRSPNIEEHTEFPSATMAVVLFARSGRGATGKG